MEEHEQISRQRYGRSAIATVDINADLLCKDLLRVREVNDESSLEKRLGALKHI